ncbi:hypothetical protein KDL01_16135 [Actinospica durhamensis]|uniref:Uncharacterized protein n=1 Tax=Actinospica durhamensis TaxID=1508375 RepID=A0A941ITX2_9ACTN|nr:hypothetical protein [Actinospica durhamensis]MBR7834806.1 hypothetical protein [Actinospica durhamensis]
MPPSFRLGRRERPPASLHTWLTRVLAEEPALGDASLRRAARHAAMGSWEHARDLLAATGKDWALRTHRVSVLAHGALGLQWATAWLLAEPESLDARVLGAQVDVLELRALILRRDPSATNELAAAVVEGLEELAELAPADPGPWISLLTLAPVLGEGRAVRTRWGEASFETGEQSFEWFREAVARDPENWLAHQLMLRAQISRLRMSPPRESLALLDYAAAVAAAVDPESPLIVLGVHAAAALDQGALVPLLRPSELGWFTERLGQDLDAAFEGWFRGAGLRRHPQAGYDLAALAGALNRARRGADAHEVAAELAALTGVALPPDAEEPSP